MLRIRTAALVAAGTMLMAAAIAVANETITYTYDVQGRLVRVLHNGSVNDDLSVNYAFDNADSRVDLNVTGSPNSPP